MRMVDDRGTVNLDDGVVEATWLLAADLDAWWGVRRSVSS
jgi:hypothetical protein